MGNKGSAVSTPLFPPDDGAPPDLASYDIILVNSSGGKDSQTCLRAVVQAARDAGVSNRVVVVHADLGRVEWPGTRELAERQASFYPPIHRGWPSSSPGGLRFVTCRRGNDLLLQMEFERQKWPDKANRWCTSDQKTAQVAKVMTALAREHREVIQVGREGRSKATMRPVRILNCLGIRAQESPDRSKEIPFRHEDRASNGRRHVDRWYPIFRWTLDQVWDDIRASGVPHHPAYDLGMPRLSCAFCVFASRSALTLAAQHLPELAAEYVRVELKTGHTFKRDLSMEQVVADARALPSVTAIDDWRA